MKKLFNCLVLFSLALLPACQDNKTEQTINESRAIQYNGIPVPEDKILLYSHRAVRGLLPEHTLEGYTLSLEIGADYMDMDICMTKDGVLVVTHDLTLNKDLTRDSDGNWIEESIPVYQLTLEELKKYNVGMLKPGSKYASYFPEQKALDASIPTLEEVIDHVINIGGKGIGFQIEIKTDPTLLDITATPAEFAKALQTIIVKKNIANRTEVQAFDWRCLIELHKVAPDVKTAYLTDNGTLASDEVGAWTAGLKLKDFNNSVPRMVKHLNGNCWEPYEGDLTKEELDEARRLGLKVVVWGWPEMEESEFHNENVTRMIDWRVDGIITDRPDLARALLKSKGYDVP